MKSVLSRAAVWAAPALAAILGMAGTASQARAAEAGLTFFGWSDQHVQTDGNADHLIPAIDAMNALPGTPYPDRFGGTVNPPDFVFGCGDITEWPTHAAKERYAELIEKRLKFPSYDIPGNHDAGGKVPSETVHRWIAARHGALSYVFEKGGVRFLAVHADYDESLNNPAQPVPEKALRFIRAELNKVPEDVPVVVALHLCFDAITNRDALVDALQGKNVILVLGGHYHQSKADVYRSIRFLQLPSPAPNSPSEIMVVRITPDRLLAIPYDYEKRVWVESPRKMLDAAIRGPVAAVSAPE